MKRSVVTLGAGATLLALSLSGCGQTAHTNAAYACDSLSAAGAASERIKVATGKKLPHKLKLASETTVTKTQRSVSGQQDTGDRLVPGAVAAVSLAVYDSATGKQVYKTGQANPNIASDFLDIPKKPGASPLADVLRCAAAGERITAVFSHADSLPFGNDFGVTPGAYAISVIDVKNVAVSRKAEGAKQRLPYGFPAVTRAASGVPGIVLPPMQGPDSLQVATSILGTGRQITTNDALVIQFVNFSWDGAVTGSSWESTPQLLSPTDESAGAWRERVNGLPVGSQVVVMQPGAGEQPASVVVIDILAAG